MGDLTIDSAKCTACRACELACNFHHTGEFGTSQASIHILYDGCSGTLEIHFDGSCDRCTGIRPPFCVDSCTPAALQMTSADRAGQGTA